MIDIHTPLPSNLGGTIEFDCDGVSWRVLSSPSLPDGEIIEDDATCDQSFYTLQENRLVIN